MNKQEAYPGGDDRMKQHLDLDMEKMKCIEAIKLQVFTGELSPADARKLVNETSTSAANRISCFPCWNRKGLTDHRK